MRADDLNRFFSDAYLFYSMSLTSAEEDERDVDAIQTLLDIGPGSLVLDLGCGYGRIANRLARRGHQVIGIDRSAKFLNTARAQFQDHPISALYIQADMRCLPFSGRFDYVVLWQTTFGYFSDAENHQVLKEVARVLRPGGTLLIDHVNRDALVHTWPRDYFSQREGSLLVERQRHEIADGRLIGERIMVHDGIQESSQYSVRLLTAPEIREWLQQAGFEEIRVLGPQGEPFGLESRRMEVLACKPKHPGRMKGQRWDEI